MHPICIEMLAQIYHQERMEEAGRLRLLYLAKEEQPQLSQRILSAFGEFLIHVGMKLKTRNQSTC